MREFQNAICSIRTEFLAGADICRMFDALWGGGFRLPANFEALPHSNKRLKLNEAGLFPGQINELLSLSAQRNTVRALAGSLRPAASGVQSYKNFCGFIRRPLFRPMWMRYSNGADFFRTGRTFAQYLAHVMKACILPQQPTDWMSPAIKSVARGLESAQNLPFEFQNYIPAGDLLTIVKSAKLDNDFGLVCFFSFPLLLRVPSETLLMRRVGDSGRITKFPPQKSKILVCVRTVKGTPLFAAKFSWRKNMRHGCILRRPCLCDEKSPLARYYSRYTGFGSGLNNGYSLMNCYSDRSGIHSANY